VAARSRDRRRVHHVVRGHAQAGARRVHRRPRTSPQRPPHPPGRAGLGRGAHRGDRASGRPGGSGIGVTGG
jgi:hypothetical protein